MPDMDSHGVHSNPIDDNKNIFSTPKGKPTAIYLFAYISVHLRTVIIFINNLIRITDVF